MTDLDYTNIAGSPFQPYVDTQIEKRKALLNKDYRTPSEINWLSNRNVWIRISSGANVSPGNKRYQGLEGNELSKKYILQGGLLNHLPDKDTYLLRSGIGPDGAYGIGGTDFGLVPMPGLTSISIKTGGKLGTLKETTFDFVCHNMEQLNIMEALYMKLGFGILVEWGHTNYINNSTGNIEINPQPLPFYGIHTKEKLMEEITSHRVKYFGNYDATWGIVKNFTYTLDGNGRFNCQVQLVGAGDILESLKVNLSGEFKNDISGSTTSGSIYPVVADQNLSLLNKALYYIYSKDVIKGENISFKIEDTPEYLASIEPFLGNLNYWLGDSWVNNTELERKGYHYRLINEPGISSNTGGDIDTKVPPILTPSSFFGRLILGYEINGEGLNEGDDTKPGLEQVYITLGHLLLLIMSNGMLFQNNDQDKTFKPYNYIDINPETNRCYTFLGHCSLDPSVCLIGSNQLPFGITSRVFEDIQKNYPFFDNDGMGGKFMYTLVNVNWIASILKKWRTNDAKGNVYFADLVKDILNGISKATGGYNEFRIVPDDDSRCIRILDDRRTVGPGQPIPTYTEIPILGKKSIVYNFNYTSKIAPNTAAMIVVAAQAQPYGVQGAENSLAFSHLNKGLYNRLGTVTIDSATNLNQSASTNDSTEQRYIELRDYIENIYSGQGTGAASITPQEVKEQEKQLGVDEYDEDLNQVSKDQVKRLALLRLDAIYNDLRNSSSGLEQERDELSNLAKSYNKVREELNSSTNEDIIIGFATGYLKSNLNIVTYKDTKLYFSIHDKLEKAYSEYLGFFDNQDTPIEAKWTELAAKQSATTGYSWY